MYPNYFAVAAGAGIGLLEGSEISMFTAAAAARYGWRRAWLVVLSGMLALVPLLAALYVFFTIMPTAAATLAAGAVIFLLGAHFFKEGLDARRGGKDMKKEERGKIGVGLAGIYSAILLEEIEAGGICMSIGAAAGGAYSSVITGMAVGLAVPLVALRALQPLIERIPEWVVQMAVGAVMMAVAVLVIAYRF